MVWPHKTKPTLPDNAKPQPDLMMIVLSIIHLETYLNEFLFKMQNFIFQQIHLKILFAK